MPKPPAPKTIPPAGATNKGGRTPKYDWAAIRREYIRGDESVSLEALSTKTGYPTLSTIKKRSSSENWPDLRVEFRYQVGTKMRELDLDVKAEVRSTLGKVGHMLIGLSVRGAAHIDPQKLEPIDVARFAKVGADLKIKAAGMDELKIRLGRIKSADDLDGLPEADLWTLAGMLPPSEQDDDDF